MNFTLLFFLNSWKKPYCANLNHLGKSWLGFGLQDCQKKILRVEK